MKKINGITFSDDEKEIIRFPKEWEGPYVVPNNVISLADSSFSDCKGLTSISLPDSVTQIGRKCFWGCSKLESIKLPKDIREIGEDCFVECESLKAITNASSCFFNCIDGVLFSINNSELVCYPANHEGESYTIPKGVVILSKYGFLGCSKLKSIIIPDSVAEINQACFKRCENLEVINIPASVHTIEEECFNLCWSLREINVSNFNSSYTSIDGVLFSKDKETLIKCPGNFKGRYQVPEGVIELSEDSFFGCHKLTHIMLPASLETLGTSCFHLCLKLNTLVCYSKKIESQGFLALDSFYNVKTTLLTIYAYKDYWRHFEIFRNKKFVDIEGSKYDISHRCETPIIEFNDGKLSITCSTKNSVCYYTISSVDCVSNAKVINDIQLKSEYKITAIAKAPKLGDSLVATAVIRMNGNEFEKQ